MRFIQLPGHSTPLYVSKSSFSENDSSWFDWNDKEAVLFPNWNHLLWKWDNFFIPTPMRLIQLPGDSPPHYVSKSSFSQSDWSWFDWNDDEVVLFPNLETGITWFESGITSSSQLLWDLFNFLVILHHFMYPNQASHKVIHPGLIGTRKKLCYSQTGKLESPDLKVG